MSVFTVIVVLIVLVIADVVAKQVAEYEIASQITSADSSIHPSVTIQGFPFLTQVISRDLKEIDISASNVAAGPVTITSVSAKAKGVHVNGSFNGGEVDSISGTVFIGFQSLSSALSSQSQGIGDVSLTAAGPHSIKASFGVGGANLLTETGTVAMKGMQVSVTWSQSGGDSGGILASYSAAARCPPSTSRCPSFRRACRCRASWSPRRAFPSQSPHNTPRCPSKRQANTRITMLAHKQRD